MLSGAVWFCMVLYDSVWYGMELFQYPFLGQASHPASLVPLMSQHRHSPIWYNANLDDLSDIDLWTFMKYNTAMCYTATRPPDIMPTLPASRICPKKGQGPLLHLRIVNFVTAEVIEKVFATFEHLNRTDFWKPVNFLLVTELTGKESQEYKQKQGQQHLQDSSGLELEHWCGRSNLALHQSVYSCKYVNM